MKPRELFLDFQSAVIKEAKQNFERDVRKHLIGRGERHKLMSIYRKEAEIILRDAGHGYYPDYPDHDLVHVA